MDRLLRRIRSALGDRPKRPHPGPPPGADASPARLLALFREKLERASGRFVTVPDEPAARAFLERGYAGREPAVDRADLLVAETGTVVRSYPSREASRVSLVPEVSVFLATPDRIVPDQPAALARLEAAHRAGPAYTVFVTGPSRTADIEKELVIPAHGPRELVVILVGTPAD